MSVATGEAAPDGTAGDPPRRARPATPLVDAWSVAIVVLAAAQPFAAFAATNAANLIDPARVLVLGLAWVAAMLAALVAVRLVRRTSPPLPAALGTAVFSLSFWSYSRWLPAELSGTALRVLVLVLWALVTALLVRLAVKVARFGWVRPFATIFLAVWTLGALVGYTSERAALAGGDHPTATDPGAGTPFVERPDVYWIVLDEHARADALERITGADTAWFGDELRELGFSVSDRSVSAYPHTILSLTSTLSMDYPFTPGHDYRSQYVDTGPLVAGANPVVEAFVGNGYRYVYAPAGRVEWSRCPPADADVSCIEPVGAALAMAEPDSTLATQTPLSALDLPSTYNDLDSVGDGLDRLGDDGRPTFVFAHILNPHEPFRFDTGCGPRDQWIYGSGLTGEERAAAYANEVGCLDRRVVDTVAGIVAADPDAVVIVQSDHGSKLTFDWEIPYERWNDAQLTERFSALNAIRLPAACRGDDIDGEPLVNTFRIVLACLRGTEPELLGPRSFFSSSFSHLDGLVEVPPDRLDPS